MHSILNEDVTKLIFLMKIKQFQSCLVAAMLLRHCLPLSVYLNFFIFFFHSFKCICVPFLTCGQYAYKSVGGHVFFFLSLFFFFCLIVCKSVCDMTSAYDTRYKQKFPYGKSIRNGDRRAANIVSSFIFKCIQTIFNILCTGIEFDTVLLPFSVQNSYAASIANNSA